MPHHEPDRLITVALIIVSVMSTASIVLTIADRRQRRRGRR